MAALTAYEIALQDDTNVVAHLERKAAARHAQAKEEGWTFYTVPSTFDAERFENVYEYELTMALNEFSDIHKEVYGFRPRVEFHDWTLTDVEARIHELCEQQDALLEREREQEAAIERERKQRAEEAEWMANEGAFFAFQDKLMGY